MREKKGGKRERRGEICLGETRRRKELHLTDDDERRKKKKGGKERKRVFRNLVRFLKTRGPGEKKKEKGRSPTRRQQPIISRRQFARKKTVRCGDEKKKEGKKEEGKSSFLRSRPGGGVGEERRG